MRARGFHPIAARVFVLSFRSPEYISGWAFSRTGCFVIGNDQRGNKLPMNTRQPMRHPLHIDQEHNNIIRAEVGERLRIILRLARPTNVPQRIRHLLHRLAKLDHEIENKTSPSIVPSPNEGWVRRLFASRFR